MFINRFTDTLFDQNRETFFTLIADVEELKQQFKTERRRVQPTYGSIAGYELTKVISQLLRKVRDSRRIKQETAITCLKNAVLQLNRLCKKFAEYQGLEQITAKVRQFADTAFSLLPSGTMLQLELFAADPYETDQPLPTTSSFRKWLKYFYVNPRLGLNYQPVATKSVVSFVELKSAVTGNLAGFGLDNQYCLNW